MAMRALAFLVVLWTMPFLYFGWRAWATWPSKRERERQREISKLYDHHFDRRRATTAREENLAPVAREHRCPGEEVPDRHVGPSS
jgi:hypothetical protein